MNKIQIGLIGYGNVGQGVVKLLQKRKFFIKEKYNTEFVLNSICDKIIHKRNTRNLKSVTLTKDFQDILKNKDIDVVVELIGGMHPAREIALGAIHHRKHLVTANKELIANIGKELFREATHAGKHVFYESSVGAGVPIINTITNGIAGNQFNGLYGIINGTCNFILSEMTKNRCTFDEALKAAQKNGFAETDPTLDINGMDSTHKLAILVYLALGKVVKVKDIYCEGITHISNADIEYAENLGLTIKLLAIAKKIKSELEVRVHPTLISKDHPLANVDGIYNAIFLDAESLGNLLLQGEGAGQMAAASGILSDLINLATRPKEPPLPILANLYKENSHYKLKKIEEIQTKFYIRMLVKDRPGVLSKISGILGQNGISIASVSQKELNKSVVPVVMLTDFAPENKLRHALDKITKLREVKGNPVAIRMETLS